MQQKSSVPLTHPAAPLRWPTIGARQILAIAIAIAALAGLALIPGDLSPPARIALATFVLTVIGWTLTKFNDTFVALFGAGMLVISSTISSESFFASLGSSVVWLMVGAFIVAGALNKSGLSARLTAAVAGRARTVGQLFHLLTAALLITAIVIPSTSARAALMIPIYMAMAAAFRDPQINRALAIMLPVNVLQTAVASLVGAGAHLVINDILRQFTGRSLTFVEWLAMGLPFAAISAFGTTWVILRIFLDPQRRARQLTREALQLPSSPAALTLQEKFISGVTLTLALLWATESIHGIDNAIVAILGALAVTAPHLGVLKFKEAVKSIEWEMIMFVAATLALSEALVASGAGGWLVDSLLGASGDVALGSELVALVVVAAVTLTSHLYMTSRSARGAVIAPLTVLLAYRTGLDPWTLAFVTAAGIGYCITLVVSAKPLTMFQQANGDGAPTFRPSDLLRLSAWLAPLHLGLLLLFGIFYWPLFGGALSADSPQRSPLDAARRGAALVELNHAPEQLPFGLAWPQPAPPADAALAPAEAGGPPSPADPAPLQRISTILDPEARAAGRAATPSGPPPAPRVGAERIRAQPTPP